MQTLDGIGELNCKQPQPTTSDSSSHEGAVPKSPTIVDRKLQRKLTRRKRCQMRKFSRKQEDVSRQIQYETSAFKAKLNTDEQAFFS